MATRQEIAAQIETLKKDAVEFAVAVAARGGPTAEDALAMEQRNVESTALRDQLAGTEKFEAALGSLNANADYVGKPANRPPLLRGDDPVVKRDLRSYGARYVEDDRFKAWRASIATDQGRIPDTTKFGTSPALNIGSFFAPQSALITGTSSTSAGALVVNDRYSDLVPLYRPLLTLRELVTNLETGSDAIEYVRITAEVNNADVVAEATATSGSSGVKPESDFSLEIITTNVKTIANWMAATRRALQDASQLRGYIDAFLKNNLEVKLEQQMVQGTGTGEQFTGIFNTTGTQTQAWDAEGIFDTTRKAVTKLQDYGEEPTAFLFSPATIEFLDLQKDNENRYYNGGPYGAAARTLWGYPVVRSNSLPAGYGLAGNFRMAILWDRMEATIQVSDSHSDFFVRNLIAILAEERAAFGVLKPSAFVEIDVAA